MLIFLSKGYMYSRNCLREARAAMANNTPLVLVREADPSKGGLSMASVREECPFDLRPFVFERGRRVIRW